MSFHKRLARLEKISVRNNHQIKISHFVVMPKHNPVAYQYGDTIIERNQGESIEAFQQRCADSIDWPSDPKQRVIFKIPNDD